MRPIQRRQSDKSVTTDETAATDETATHKTDAVPVPQKQKRQLPAVDIRRVRIVLAQLVWLVCVVFALVLAIAVLLIAVKANLQNGLVKFDGRFADHIDLHWFDLNNPVKDFDTSKAPLNDVKTALFNYGIAAIVWLVIGRVLDRLIRPGSAVKK